MFKAELFDADAWASLFKQSGAKVRLSRTMSLLQPRATICQRYHLQGFRFLPSRKHPTPIVHCSDLEAPRGLHKLAQCAEVCDFLPCLANGSRKSAVA